MVTDRRRRRMKAPYTNLTPAESLIWGEKNRIPTTPIGQARRVSFQRDTDAFSAKARTKLGGLRSGLLICTNFAEYRGTNTSTKPSLSPKRAERAIAAPSCVEGSGCGSRCERVLSLVGAEKGETNKGVIGQKKVGRPFCIGLR